jgi:hypothetical protein
VDDRLRDGERLALAARDPPRPGLEETRDAEPLRGARRARGARRRGHAPRARGVLEAAADGQLVVEPEEVGEETEPAVALPRA